MKMKGQPLTILIDLGGSSSHITRNAANKLGVSDKIRRHPLLIYGFGNSRSKPVTKFASLILVGARNEKNPHRFQYNRIRDNFSAPWRYSPDI